MILTANLDVGANPSAEEGEEATDDAAQQVIDVVHSFRLNETSFDKKSYLTHLKGKPFFLSVEPKDNI
jgi:hypothetical protein